MINSIDKNRSESFYLLNRLKNEQSPYLLQHAHNPVDWYPWGEEAFEKARRENKPVFLSIGYSACHWCHVMARECFEDADVAALLNKDFVSIKVDREERPDVDHFYMTAAQAMNGSGGWPLTVFMDHNKKPFFTGTYYPKFGVYGRPGLMDLLPAIKEVWTNRREEISDTANKIYAWLLASMPKPDSTAGGEELPHASYQILLKNYDAVNGGFGTAPKFPMPHYLLFLLHYGFVFENPEAVSLALHTLKAMRAGGIYDHIGHGFHRYSTDARWFLPHFEKMLYDQALLTTVYTEAYRLTRNPFFMETAEEIIRYVLRRMQNPEGGFYASEDADSDGGEGRYYLWSDAELRQILTPEEHRLLSAVWNTIPEGNHIDEATREPSGLNLFYRRKDREVLARERAITEPSLRASMEAIRRKILHARENRKPPLKDDKILTDWNGLMISALASAYRVTNKTDYLEAAERAAAFIASHLRQSDGRLLKRYRNGHSAIPSVLDDYAFMATGLLDVFTATFNPAYLEQALRLAQILIDDFWDEDNGGFYLSSRSIADYEIRSKDLYDGACPSGHAAAAGLLHRLYRITHDTTWNEYFIRLTHSYGHSLRQNPSGHIYFIDVLTGALKQGYDIIICGRDDDPVTRRMLADAQKYYTPYSTIIFISDTNQRVLQTLAPYLENYHDLSGLPTGYLCRNRACEKPVTDPAEWAWLLNRNGSL